MASNFPVAMKRLVIRPTAGGPTATLFLPFVGTCDDGSQPSAHEVSGELAREYRSIDFDSLTMNDSAVIWADIDLLVGSTLLDDFRRISGVVVPSAVVDTEEWPDLSKDLRSRGITIYFAEHEALDAYTSAEVVGEAVLVSVSEPLVSVRIANLQERGFKVIALDASREEAHDNTFNAEFYVGPGYYAGEHHHAPLDPSEAQCLEALKLLGEPEADLNKVSEVLSTDPEMTVRVLHLANSAAVGSIERIDSLRHAIVYLGSQQISSLTMASMISARIPNPQDMWFILARAAACKKLAHGVETAYTAGLLSALAEEANESPEAMAARAGVSFEVSLAMTSGAGDLGSIVDAVRAYERGSIAEIYASGLDPFAVAQAYFDVLPRTKEHLNIFDQMPRSLYGKRN